MTKKITDLESRLAAALLRSDARRAALARDHRRARRPIKGAPVPYITPATPSVTAYPPGMGGPFSKEAIARSEKDFRAILRLRLKKTMREYNEK